MLGTYSLFILIFLPPEKSSPNTQISNKIHGFKIKSLFTSTHQITLISKPESNSWNLSRNSSWFQFTFSRRMRMNPPADAAETSPLLAHSLPDHLNRSRRLLRRPPPPLRGAAARLLRRASGRRLMLREPSVRVREPAAEQLEERQSYWAYSRPIIVLDYPVEFGICNCCLRSVGCEYKRKAWGASKALDCWLRFAVFVSRFLRLFGVQKKAPRGRCCFWWFRFWVQQYYCHRWWRRAASWWKW